jgi:sugar O-acyltransferase (sialic acid O-acetyltransferase NeuD family)
MQRIAIYGTGGMAREALELIRHLNRVAPAYDVIGWLDDASGRAGAIVKGLPVLGPIERAVVELDPFVVTIAIGTTPIRRRLAARVEAVGCPFATLVDPRAWIGSDVEVGTGSILCAGAVVTTDVRLGRHVILNLASTVSHDAVLGDFVTLAPGVNVAGIVRIGEGCEIGIGTAILQGASIGAWSIIGAGAAVTNSVPPNVTAVGVPARVIKERPAGWHLEPCGTVSP